METNRSKLHIKIVVPNGIDSKNEMLVMIKIGIHIFTLMNLKRKRKKEKEYDNLHSFTEKFDITQP